MPWKQAVEEFDVRFSKDLATAADAMPNFKRDGVPVEAVSGVTPADRLEAIARGLGA